jgi:hypothetical protein
MATYDCADWHQDEKFPSELSAECAATHIGFYIAWIIQRGLESKQHTENEREQRATEAVRSRRMTGRDFLFRQCEAKLCDNDLNPEGIAFTEWYLKKSHSGRPTYRDDYPIVFADAPNGSIYYLRDTWENFDRIAPIIDRRFDEWQRKIMPAPLEPAALAPKPWWKIW